MENKENWSNISGDILNVAKKIKTQIDEEDIVEDLKESFKNTIENTSELINNIIQTVETTVTDEEIKRYLMLNPVDFGNGYIRHSYHRACAMIGRLINGKPYIPFYMKENLMYDEIKSDDGKQRVYPLIKNLKGLEKINIPSGEFTITQSGILALMGIRQNDDVDIIISSAARYQLFNNN